jgi:hypothetical protein
MRPRPSFLLIAVTLALALTPRMVAAQTTITPGQSSTARIGEFIGERLAQFESGNPISIRQARMDLLTHLRDPDANSAFRFQYSAALQQAGLTRLATSDEDLVAINAIIVAGELATQLSVTILDRAADDARPAVRLVAARSMGVTLSALADGSAAIPANQVDAVFTRIEDWLTVEDDVFVIDALLVACNAPQDDAALRARSIRVMCDGAASISSRWRALGAIDEAQTLTIFRAIDTAFSELIAVQGNVDRDFARSAAIASGQALVFLTEWLNANPPALMSPEDRQLAIDLGAAAERVILLAHTSLTNEQQAENITKQLRNFVEDERGVTLNDVRAAIDAWAGPNGRLTTAPYNVNASDFN